MEASERGIEVNNVFKYARQVLQQVHHILKDSDSLMEPEWYPVEMEISDLSLDLDEPESWLIKNAVRVYESNNEYIQKIITIILWGDDLEVPVIIAGKAEYTDLEERNPWDLWYAWTNTENKSDGSTFEYTNTSKVTFFSYPLTLIESRNEVEQKIILPLKDL